MRMAHRVRLAPPHGASLPSSKNAWPAGLRVDERWSFTRGERSLKARRASGERRRRIKREDIDAPRPQ